MALTQQQIDIVKSTVPILQEHGATITTTFYRNIITEHPQLKNLFSVRNQATGAQQSALARAVLAYATYIDDLPKLTGAVERIAQKHASLFVLPEHYPIVGQFLVGAFAEVLGDGLTEEVKAAWIAAYGVLADVFIGREGQLYKEAGEWNGWRKFVIKGRENENSTVVNFDLAPATEGESLQNYRPGQYISLQVPIPEAGFVQSRQYSLVEAPQKALASGHYRISVKKEDSTPETVTPEQLAAGSVSGSISNLLFKEYKVGDIVELSPPRGEFFIDPSDPAAATKPLVLISGGIGAAPLHSILDSVLDSPSASRPISWVHGARGSNTSCYAKHIREQAASHPNIVANISLETIAGGDVKGEAYDAEGQLNLDNLGREGLLHLENPEAEYYICGPEPWMVLVRGWLEGKGVSLARQHLELFKTGDV
jgi:nitric oxide dioxygenase